MKYTFIFIFLSFISIILFIFSCDVLTKMNETEWNKKNLEEVKEDIFFIYTSGYYVDATDDDFFTVKFDENGRDIWLRRRNIIENDRAYGLTINGSGNIYIAGGVNNENDFYIIEYDNNGNFINSRIDDYVLSERYNGITSDPSNNVYITGTNMTDCYTFKFDSTLNPFFGGPDIYNSGGIDRGYGIVYKNNSIYVAGCSSFGDMDICIIKYDASNFTRSITYYPLIVEGLSQEARDIAIDNNGNIYVIGTVDLLFGGNYDYILLKYDPDLNLIWEKIININVDDRGEGVEVDSAGNVYIAVHSGTGPGNFDCYTISYDQLGIERWSRKYGTDGVDDQLWDITVDPKGNVYSVGNSNNNFLIIKYGFYGDQRWIRNFDIGGNDQARAVVIGKQ